MNVNQLLEYAIQEVKELNSGEVFLVRELFKGYLWSEKYYKGWHYSRGVCVFSKGIFEAMRWDLSTKRYF